MSGTAIDEPKRSSSVPPTTRTGLRLAELVPADLRRVAELVERYADLGLGATDASVVAIAERLGVQRVATFDRRHVPVVVPSHASGLTLLP